MVEEDGKRSILSLEVIVMIIEPPHKLEEKAFNAKKFYIIFQNYAKRIEKSYILPKMAIN